MNLSKNEQKILKAIESIVNTDLSDIQVTEETLDTKPATEPKPNNDGKYNNYIFVENPSDMATGAIVYQQLDEANKAKSDKFLVTDLFSFFHKTEVELNNNYTGPLDNKEALLKFAEKKAIKELKEITTLNYIQSLIATEEAVPVLHLMLKQEEDKDKHQDTKNNGLSVAVAARRVKETVEKSNELQTSLFGSSDDKQQLESSSLEDKAKLAKMLRDAVTNRNLQKLINSLGRLKSIAIGVQRYKINHDYDDMVDIITSDSLSNLLALELAKLSDELLQLDFIKRLTEKKLLCYNRYDLTDAAFGPVVVVVDESGSMSHIIHEAKAIALALCYIAKRQNRKAIVVRFSSSVESFELCLANHKQLSNFMTTFMSASTRLDAAMREAAKYLKQEFYKADLVVITDAELLPNVANQCLSILRDLSSKVRRVLIHTHHSPKLGGKSVHDQIDNLEPELDLLIKSNDLVLKQHELEEVFAV